MIPFPFMNASAPPSSKLGFVAKPEMPPHINILFRARPPLEYCKPFDPPKYRRYDGIIESVRNYFSLFEEGPPPERLKEETLQERKERAWKEKVLKHREKIKDQIRSWRPKENPDATSDPYKTLFVCGLDKSTSSKHLRRVFEEYGPIKKLVMIHDVKTGKPKYYAFIEFQNLSDFKRAYKKANGIKIDGRRIVVDYERGRTLSDWKPRRFGGGKGDSRRSRENEKKMLKILEQAEAEEEERYMQEDKAVPALDASTKPEAPDCSHIQNRLSRERSRTKERISNHHKREHSSSSHKSSKNSHHSKKHSSHLNSSSSKSELKSKMEEPEPGEIVLAK